MSTAVETQEDETYTVDATVDSCSAAPGHEPHLRQSMIWPDTPPDQRQRWLWCLGGYDRARQLNRVQVQVATVTVETLVAEGGKPWECPSMEHRCSHHYMTHGPEGCMTWECSCTAVRVSI